MLVAGVALLREVLEGCNHLLDNELLGSHVVLQVQLSTPMVVGRTYDRALHDTRHSFMNDRDIERCEPGVSWRRWGSAKVLYAWLALL